MPQEKVPVQYVARKSHIVDGLYSTGRWDHETNAIKLLDPALAAKLMRHADVWKMAPPEAAKTHVAEVVEDALTQRKATHAEDPDVMDLRDRVMKMDRDAIVQFGADKYRLRIKANSSLESARAALLNHIDIAGAV
jgi:hypothetical protein